MRTKTYDEKVEYFEKEVKRFKKGLPVFFAFNLFILIIIPIIIIASLVLFYTQIELLNNTFIGFNVAVSFLVTIYIIFTLTANESIRKFRKLIIFIQEKNDFILDPLETNLALRILEKSPIELKDVLADPMLSLDKTKRLISLMEFCDFIQIKKDVIYQSGLHLIE